MSRLAACVFAAFSCLALTDSVMATDKWFYVARNLQVDENVDIIDKLMQRASAVGYNKMLLTDSKFSRLGDVTDRYFVNARKVQDLARKYQIEIIPTVFPMGRSNSLLYHNPNLAEALPVKGLPLWVGADGNAIPKSETSLILPGGDMSDLNRWSSHDDCVVSEHGTARIQPNGGNARLIQELRVAPHRQYHVSVRIKTSNFEGQPEIKALGPGGVSLQWANLGVKTTQDWTEHHAVFNSQKYSGVNLYFGAWGAKAGDLWWDDAKIEEVPFLNLVRRPGAPLVIRRLDGTILQEGTDYETLTDPLMGLTDPYLGNKPIKGEYSVYHAPPILKTKLPAGTTLTADYYHAVTVYDGQVMICPSEPQTVELLRDQMQRMQKLWNAKSYMMAHDEIRCLNHCAACRARQQTPGEIVAENVRACIKIVREVAPDSKIYVWSDMFDPHHNAIPGPYYLVNGTLEKGWEGLDKDVIIVNWNFEKRAESLKGFAERGHNYIIAGYYDEDLQHSADWLQTAKTVPGMQGIMYTTWENRYDDLEKFSQIVDEGSP